MLKEAREHGRLITATLPPPEDSGKLHRTTWCVSPTARICQDLTRPSAQGHHVLLHESQE
jgi:hypothetical protein